MADLTRHLILPTRRCLARARPSPLSVLSVRQASTAALPSTSSQASAPPPPPSAPEPKRAPGGPKKAPLIGRVAAAGLMDKTARVERRAPMWDGYLRKYWKGKQTYHVHDAAGSLVAGDVVSIRALATPRTAKVRWAVQEILVPFGKEISARPAVVPVEEVELERRAKEARREERRVTRGLAESGDGGAKEKVEREGWAIRVVEKGTGSRHVVRRRVLEKDVARVGGRVVG